MRSSATTIASILFFIDAVIWLVGLVPTLGYTFQYRILPTMGGIKLLGGPFESLGIEALVVAGLVFVVVSALKIMSAYWLWNARKDGVIFGLILLGLSVIFWYGFALPLGPLFGIAQVMALILAWRSIE